MDHIKGLQVVNVKEQLDLTEALRMADVWNQKRMIPYRKCQDRLDDDIMVYLSFDAFTLLLQ